MLGVRVLREAVKHVLSFFSMAGKAGSDLHSGRYFKAGKTSAPPSALFDSHAPINLASNSERRVTIQFLPEKSQGDGPQD